MTLRIATGLMAALIGLGASANAVDLTTFKATMLAACQASPEPGMDCECTVELMDAEFDDKTKKIFLIIMDPAIGGDEAKAEAALKAEGLSMADVEAMTASVSPIMAKAEQQCKTPAATTPTP
jgi:hypothetical protein